jgi:hypothetical protein
MAASHSDLQKLISLIEAAKAGADRLGPDGGTTAGHLDQALVAARAIDAHGGRPDEGVPVENLTTDNDK